MNMEKIVREVLDEVLTRYPKKYLHMNATLEILKSYPELDAKLLSI